MNLTVEQARSALDDARTAFQEEMDRDTHRGEGSQRQDNERMRRQKEMGDEITQCERRLKEAESGAAGQ